MKLSIMLIASWFIIIASAFWDLGSTTLKAHREYKTRNSRFIWPKTKPPVKRYYFLWFYYWDYSAWDFHRRLFCIAGITIDFTNLSTGVILTRRVVLTAANYLDPYMDQQYRLRIWGLGRAGVEVTPFRYRVWRITRLFARNQNNEYCHGRYCYHSPLHDVAIIHSLDQIYVSTTFQPKWQYAYRGWLPDVHETVVRDYDLWYTGCGHETLKHVYDNFEIRYTKFTKDWIVDCGDYFQQKWGKFICIRNQLNHVGVQNGGPMFSEEHVIGIGSFEIRVNDDRVLVFTDVKAYLARIFDAAHYEPGEYYEYAYPQWGTHFLPNGTVNYPFIPQKQVWRDVYPMGK